MLGRLIGLQLFFPVLLLRLSLFIQMSQDITSDSYMRTEWGPSERPPYFESLLRLLLDPGVVVVGVQVPYERLPSMHLVVVHERGVLVHDG